MEEEEGDEVMKTRIGSTPPSPTNPLRATLDFIRLNVDPEAICRVASAQSVRAQYRARGARYLTRLLDDALRETARMNLLGVMSGQDLRALATRQIASGHTHRTPHSSPVVLFASCGSWHGWRHSSGRVP